MAAATRSNTIPSRSTQTTTGHVEACVSNLHELGALPGRPACQAGSPAAAGAGPRGFGGAAPRQSARIAAQRNPDGTPYEPRKPQLRHKRGGIRRGMFTRLRMAKSMRIEGSPNMAVVTFRDEVKRVAAVHHFGLRDRVNARAGLPSNTRHESY
ncbi:phage virion morphogenesis protein [Ralstonia flatus]|uniref:phage virion morphogenesis protein n=1 Tax=Ralstonia flatus TaxID=3058601 RepID=UPI003977CDF5